MNYLKILEMKLRDNQQWQLEIQEGIEELETVERFEVDAELQEMKQTEAKIIKLHFKICAKETLMSNYESMLKTAKVFNDKNILRGKIKMLDTDLQKLYKEVK